VYCIYSIDFDSMMLCPCMDNHTLPCCCCIVALKCCNGQQYWLRSFNLIGNRELSRIPRNDEKFWVEQKTKAHVKKNTCAFLGCALAVLFFPAKLRPKPWYKLTILPKYHESSRTNAFLIEVARLQNKLLTDCSQSVADHKIHCQVPCNSTRQFQLLYIGKPWLAHLANPRPTQ
jgi:hypothetical protein